ncbi:MAG: nuclear transport factor 2 family protein [Verrucomicrobiota bacterium]|nr:nuclear transport factor 2 family protein [Verrucomicrobiota bacterium]
MKTSFIISVIVAGLATLALAAGAESELKALEQQWSDAYKNGDTAILKSIEAEDFKLVDPDGKVVTKAQDIKELGDKTFKVESFSFDELNVRMLSENFAYVTGLQILKGAYKGEDISGQYRFLDVFQKKGGKWQAIASQVTRVAKK